MGGWDRGNISYSGGHGSGGLDYREEILKWNGSAWEEIGKMEIARADHAVSIIKLDDEVLQFCG